MVAEKFIDLFAGKECIMTKKAATAMIVIAVVLLTIFSYVVHQYQKVDFKLFFEEEGKYRVESCEKWLKV